MPPTKGLEIAVRVIGLNIRRRHPVEDKVRIVLEGRKGGTSVAGLCRREGPGPNLSRNGSKEFPGVGKRRSTDENTGRPPPGTSMPASGRTSR